MTDPVAKFQGIAGKSGDPAKIDTPNEAERASRVLQNQIGKMSSDQVSDVGNMCAEDTKLYGVFGDRAEIAKAQADSAMKYVLGMIDRENSVRGGKPYELDLEAHPFPQPETYLHKTVDNKGKARPTDAYYAWKEAVDDWKQTVIEEVQAHTNTSLSNLSDQVSNVQSTIDENFILTYMQFGLTRDFIIQTWADLKGDIDKVKAKLDESIQAIHDEGAATRKTIIDDGNQTRQEQRNIGEILQQDIIERLPLPTPPEEPVPTPPEEPVPTPPEEPVPTPPEEPVPFPIPIPWPRH